MKSRKLGIGLLLLLAVTVTTGTFAFWSSGLGGANDSTTATVTIGEGETQSSTITLGTLTDNGSALVPTTQIASTGDDTATFTVPVSWDQDSGNDFDGASGTLVVTVVYSMAGTSFTNAQLDAMFSFSVTGDGTITEGASAQDVVVTIVFDTEPTTEAIYDEVINETLTATITYTVTAD